jgi:transposase
MSGLENTGKRFVNASLGRGYKTNEERRQEKRMKRQAALDKIYTGAEMPDPEAERRKGRKKAAMRRGSRASTILTDRETLG